MDADEWLIARMVSALTGWDFVEVDGQPVPFTPENATEILKAAPWLHKYVNAGMTAHSSFFAQKS